MSAPDGPLARLEARLTREWQRRGALAWALTPFACVFGLCAALRRTAYAQGWKDAADGVADGAARPGGGPAGAAPGPTTA